MQKAEDFNKVPEGGCTKFCGSLMGCGHNCKSLCHPLNRQHENVKCKEMCQRLVNLIMYSNKNRISCNRQWVQWDIGWCALLHLPQRFKCKEKDFVRYLSSKKTIYPCWFRLCRTICQMWNCETHFFLDLLPSGCPLVFDFRCSVICHSFHLVAFGTYIILR